MMNAVSRNTDWSRRVRAEFFGLTGRECNCIVWTTVDQDNRVLRVRVNLIPRDSSAPLMDNFSMGVERWNDDPDCPPQEVLSECVGRLAAQAALNAIGDL